MEAAAETILIVDVEARNTRLLELQLKADGYRTLLAFDGEEGLRLLKTDVPDIVLLGTSMAGMNGFSFAGHVKLDERTRHVPIIMMTTADEHEARLRALQMGVEEILAKPVDRSELRMRVRNLLRLREYQNLLAERNQTLEQQVVERTGQVSEAYRETVHTLVRAAEYKDEDAGAHVRRIGLYCRLLAEAMGLDRDFCDRIFHASPMHDVGKIAIPDAILLKPERLTPDEWKIMQGHCAFGARILETGKSPYLVMGAEIAYGHHERWDGGGYPEGRRGEGIPLSARIANLCDQYDALRSKRPHKPALAHERVIEIIAGGDERTRPDHFDPAVLSAFKAAAGRFADIFRENSD